MADKAKTQSDTMTNRQIGQLCDRLATKLRGLNLPREGAQKTLKMRGNAAIDEMAAIFRKHVEAYRDIIICRVKVNRARTPEEAVAATGRVPYIDKDVLATMPQGEGAEVEVWFIPTKRFVPAREAPAFLAQYGLVPDPRAQAAVNEADPAFADEHPNGSQWGNNCYLTFYRWYGGRGVGVGRDGYGWHDHWLLSGVPAPRK